MRFILSIGILFIILISCRRDNYGDIILKVFISDDNGDLKIDLGGGLNGCSVTGGLLDLGSGGRYEIKCGDNYVGYFEYQKDDDLSWVLRSNLKYGATIVYDTNNWIVVDDGRRMLEIPDKDCVFRIIRRAEMGGE